LDAVAYGEDGDLFGEFSSRGMGRGEGGANEEEPVGEVAGGLGEVGEHGGWVTTREDG